MNTLLMLCSHKAASAYIEAGGDITEWLNALKIGWPRGPEQACSLTSAQLVFMNAWLEDDGSKVAVSHLDRLVIGHKSIPLGPPIKDALAESLAWYTRAYVEMPHNVPLRTLGRYTDG